jgi:hypothetical protein
MLAPWFTTIDLLFFLAQLFCLEVNALGHKFMEVSLHLLQSSNSEQEIK